LKKLWSRIGQGERLKGHQKAGFVDGAYTLKAFPVKETPLALRPLFLWRKPEHLKQDSAHDNGYLYQIV
jgi:hypothetical protein